MVFFKSASYLKESKLTENTEQAADLQVKYICKFLLCSVSVCFHFMT